MKWTKLALTTMTLTTVGMCFTACDPPPSPEFEYEDELTERSLEGNGPPSGTIFELDGDADDAGTSGILPADWQSLIPVRLPALEDEFPVVSFMQDTGPGEQIFSGGGSKDPEPLSKWRWKSGNATPDKDNITNAYAAAHFTSNDEFLIFFGADRFANEGDAQLGFWFFKDAVSTSPNGRFVGDHTNGDVLVLVNFSNGGAVATVEVLEWKDDELFEKFNGNANCGNTDTATAACAITNDTTATAHWSYTTKGEDDPGDFPTYTFFEGGINITALFGGSTPPCFASFLAETRASTSESATLKDFVVRSFQECQPGMTVTADCGDEGVTLESGASGVSFIVSYKGTVENTSTGPNNDLTKVTVLGPDGLPATLTDVANDGVDVLAPGDIESYSGTFETTSINSTFPGSVTFGGDVTVTAEGFGGQDVVGGASFDGCPLCPP